MTIFLLTLAAISVGSMTYGAHKALRQGSSEDALGGLPIIGAGFLLLILDGLIWLVSSLISALT